MTTQKTISEINKKLEKGEAVVMTAMEFKKEVRSGYKFKVSDVDVVTTASRSVQSGTAGVLAVPVAEKGAFRRAQKIWLNGVPGFPSNPEERSGIVDTLIYGTEESVDYPGGYGGGHLLRDIVERKEIQVECLTDAGKILTTSFTLDQLQFARYYSQRNCFQNYYAFGNFKNLKSYRENPISITVCRPYPPDGFSHSGVGELNPLENDPWGRVFRMGMRIMVAKAPGIIIGPGTRSTPKMRCLSTAADLFQMDPEFMGGFRTLGGVEVTSSVAVPLPIIDQQILDDISKCLDENIPLHLTDMGDRYVVTDIDYGIYSGTKFEIEFDPDRCLYCGFQCPVEYYCPRGAFSWKDKRIDEKYCFNCGACTANCLGGAFKGKGDIPKGYVASVYVPELDSELYVMIRQANRHQAELLCEHLKETMEKGEFLLNDPPLEFKHWNM